MRRRKWVGWRNGLALAYLLAAAGCTAYEYEEEIFLDVDGSGSLRVSGSTAILHTLHANPVTVESMATRFRAPGLTLDSVRETERDGRRFIHVQGRFSSWNELCDHPAFAGRECRLDESEDVLALVLALPAPKRDVPADIPPDALLALRVHFPSSVRYHNAPSGIERGNIIEWERSASEHFQASDLVAEASFERRSVLATTLLVLGTAIGIVTGSVALALWVMVRKGRKQLALERGTAHTASAQRG